MEIPDILVRFVFIVGIKQDYLIEKIKISHLTGVGVFLRIGYKTDLKFLKIRYL